MSDNQIQILENDIKQATLEVNLANKLERLETNTDFIAIIEDELFNKYTVNMVHLLSESSMQNAANQEDIIKELEMVGRFRQFLVSIRQKGRQAERTILQANDAIIDMRTGGNH